MLGEADSLFERRKINNVGITGEFSLKSETSYLSEDMRTYIFSNNYVQLGAMFKSEPCALEAAYNCCPFQSVFNKCGQTGWNYVELFNSLQVENSSAR